MSTDEYVCWHILVLVFWQGHINIAQTRHFRGPQTVGESQYPANIAAILKAQMYVSPSSAGIYVTLVRLLLVARGSGNQRRCTPFHRRGWELRIVLGGLH